MTIGILLLEDFVALLALILTSYFKEIRFSGFLPGMALADTLLKGSFFLLGMFLVARFVLPILFRHIAKSQELLFLTSIAWCFLVAFLFGKIGFSAEMGGFLAGLAVGNLDYADQIIIKIRPLRDFFVVIFFVALGMQLAFQDISYQIGPAIVLLVLVLLVRPFVVFLLMSFFGFEKRTSFNTAIALSQLSEFSLILIMLGQTVGHLDQKTVSLILFVALVSIALSSYLITFSDRIYRAIYKFLKLFETTNKKELVFLPFEPENHIVLIGAHRTGGEVLKSLVQKKRIVVVIDFNPHIVRKLIKKKVPTVFGDVSDPEIFEKTKLEKAKMIISTAVSYTHLTLPTKA